MGSFKKKVSNDPSTSGMFVIEVNNVSHNNQWVLDTGCGSHICTNVQKLRDNRQLNKGDLDLRVGNKVRVVALAIGTYILTLSSGLILC